MRRRHPLPTLWLMTDERQGAALIAAVRRLPRGAGIVFRHHRVPAARRRALFYAIRPIARARGLTLLLAGPPGLARRWGADGSHGPGPAGVRSAAVHDRAELRVARGADLIFVSPVFATRSHPGAATLGLAGFARLARLAAMPVIALGGMTARRARLTKKLGGYGWGAIDGLTPRSRHARDAPDQNLKAVPR